MSLDLLIHTLLINLVDRELLFFPTGLDGSWTKVGLIKPGLRRCKSVKVKKNWNPNPFTLLSSLRETCLTAPVKGRFWRDRTEIPGCSHKVEACVRGDSLSTVNNGGLDVSTARADERVLTLSKRYESHISPTPCLG